MKTFEEAFAIISKNKQISHDFTSFSKEQFTSEVFVETISQLVERWKNEMVKIVDDGTPEFAIHCNAFTCSTFQLVFNLGLLVGIEMEKQQ